MLDLRSPELLPEEREVLQHPQVGGVILFSRNYVSPKELKELIIQIRKTKCNLLIAVDQEGGRVQRFRQGFTQLPALGEMGQLYDHNPVKAKSFAEEMGKLMASELRVYDIDFSFAPVLDLNKNISQVIGDRSFHRDSHIIIKLAQNYIAGMRKAGMGAVGKHFPGHGSVIADSHTEIPIDSRPYTEIETEDLVPFVALIKYKIEGLMPAHVIYQQVDSKPAGFSPFWLQTILREKLDFKGAIFSDDLSMAGASCMGNLNQRAETALAAGCDMVLVCNDPNGAISVIEYLEQKNYRSTSIMQSRLLKFTDYSCIGI